LGHSRPSCSAACRILSVVGPIATILAKSLLVRFVPKADMATLVVMFVNHALAFPYDAEHKLTNGSHSARHPSC
jgi:hypothetical protein